MIDHFAAPWVAADRYALRPDARRFESWENSYACRLGLGVAVEYAMAVGLDAIAERNRMLAGRLRDGLRGIAGVTLQDLGPEPCAIVSFTVEDIAAAAVKAGLAAAGINVSVSSPSSTLLDALARGLPDVVRASPHYYNSEDEVDRTVAEVRRIAGG